MIITKKVSVADGAGYIASQLIGGIVAGLIMNYVYVKKAKLKHNFSKIFLHNLLVSCM